ncbi:hypothetical protein IC235_03685 [Hymenobacter sp. BT664]|uniref:Uncharacterized protein n=1 Tax=Hymenobacter montanus TaxID=2771359 RepID=A0A927BBJ2_9BACT|nr:hypothetical protein [Hymenobacter montanus]MBD2766993.1 hypothetical protein [Hymenobacter montanus]
MKTPLSFRCWSLVLALAFANRPALGQSPAERVVVVSPTVGEVIDGAEKARFGLFPYYAADDFEEARFVRSLAADSAITLRTRLRDGRQVARPFTLAEFEAVRAGIARRLQEVGSLSPEPVATRSNASPSGSAALAPASSGTPEIIGRTYSVELRSGNRFIGVLRSATAEELEFETKDLGRVRVQRANLIEFVLLNQGQARRGYDDVGNGTRLFFAPTARNLRRGEGYVQDIDIFLLGANYGITDNFSVGVLVPVLPGLGLSVFAFTPKVSVPLTDKFTVGAGVLYARAFGYGGGIGYGVATYGTADDNVTMGLGYAFAGGEVSSTPVVVVGGAKRLSRRTSLINETYIVNGGVGGLFGLRIAASRVSGSLGGLYFSGSEGGLYPAYAEVAYRFGKIK